MYVGIMQRTLILHGHDVFIQHPRTKREQHLLKYINDDGTVLANKM
jgi:hypothetical protein